MSDHEVISSGDLGLSQGSGDFLRRFHNRFPGSTSLMFEDLGSSCSSYDIIARLVAQDSMPRSSILDLCCGDGTLLEKIAKASPDCDLYGLDFSSAELLKASSRLALARACLHEGNANAFPIPSNSVDWIVCHMSLMLLNPISTVLREIVRTMRCNGRFVSVVSAPGKVSGVLPIFYVCLKKVCAEEGFSLARFGDSDFSSNSAIRNLFAQHAPELDIIAMHELELTSVLSANAIWLKLQNLYDVRRLSTSGQLKLRDTFIGAIQALGPNTLTFPVRLILSSKRAEE